LKTNCANLTGVATKATRSVIFTDVRIELQINYSLFKTCKMKAFKALANIANFTQIVF